MVELSDGVVKLFPVPTALPPLETAYQFTVPLEAVADKVTAPSPHTEPSVPLVSTGRSFTVTVTTPLTAEHPSASYEVTL